MENFNALLNILFLGQYNEIMKLIPKESTTVCDFLKNIYVIAIFNFKIFLCMCLRYAM